MKTRSLRWLLAVGLCLCGGAARALDLYVAPDGRDAWSGRRATPRSDLTDGPFATLERARDEIRRWRATAPRAEAVTVQLRAGTYELKETFTLTSEDSGSAAAPVLYRGYRHERPRLTGGRRIGAWVPWRDAIRVADLKAEGLAAARLSLLLCGGERQILARYPNFVASEPVTGGWAYVAGKPVEMYREQPDDSRRRLAYRAEDARPMASPQAAEVCIFARYNWWNNIVPIATNDRERQILTLAADCSYAIRPGDRYYLRGLLDELDAPGEWFQDVAAGKLYFWPPEPLREAEVWAPTLDTLVSIKRGAAHIELRGLELNGCKGRAVNVTDATNCLVAACIVRNVAEDGAAALSLAGGVSNGVAGCDIFDVGGGGVAIDGGVRLTREAAGNAADNNYIHHFGLAIKHGAGIALWGVGNRATHNLIHDGPRIGIQFGGNDLVIAYNHIRHVNLETEDTGAVYSGGRDWLSSRGSLLRGNLLEDSLGFGRKNGRWMSPYYAWGIYLDDNCGGVDVIGNIVRRCANGAIHLHNARDNRIENNLFIDNGNYAAGFNGWKESSSAWATHLPTMIAGYDAVSNAPAWRGLRNMDIDPRRAVLPGGLIMSGNVLTRNIYVISDPAAKVYHFSNVPFAHNVSDSNLVWRGGPPQVAGGWQTNGWDAHSLVADPMFVAPERDDWRLRRRSPARSLGMQPLERERIGPYRDERRATWPIVEAPGAREWLAARRTDGRP